MTYELRTAEEEIKQVRTYLDQKMRYETEQRAAVLATKEALISSEALQDEQSELQFEAAVLRMIADGPKEAGQPALPIKAGSDTHIFENFDFLAKFALAPFHWGEKESEKETGKKVMMLDH